MLHNILKDLIKVVRETDSKYFELNLPRRSGKTSAVIKLQKDMSVLVLTNNHTMTAMYPKAYSSYCALETAYMGRKFSDLKYEGIIIDENTSIEVEKAILLLAQCGLLTENCFVFKVGTF